MNETKERTKHTPTPWHIDGHNLCAIIHQTGDRTYRHVGTMDNHYDTGRNEPEQVEIDVANAAFIVRAVNAHDELVAAAKEVLVEWATPLVTGESLPLRRLEVAIAKAEGWQP